MAVLHMFNRHRGVYRCYMGKVIAFLGNVLVAGAIGLLGASVHVVRRTWNPVCEKGVCKSVHVRNVEGEAETFKPTSSEPRRAASIFRSKPTLTSSVFLCTRLEYGKGNLFGSRLINQPAIVFHEWIVTQSKKYRGIFLYGTANSNLPIYSSLFDNRNSLDLVCPCLRSYVGVVGRLDVKACVRGASSFALLVFSRSKYAPRPRESLDFSYVATEIGGGRGVDSGIVYRYVAPRTMVVPTRYWQKSAKYQGTLSTRITYTKSNPKIEEQHACHEADKNADAGGKVFRNVVCVVDDQRNHDSTHCLEGDGRPNDPVVAD